MDVIKGTAPARVVCEHGVVFAADHQTPAGSSVTSRILYTIENSTKVAAAGIKGEQCGMRLKHLILPEMRETCCMLSLASMNGVRSLIIPSTHGGASKNQFKKGVEQFNLHQWLTTENALSTTPARKEFSQEKEIQKKQERL
jgi:hypothetical protein